jgi:carbonic anhydrase
MTSIPTRGPELERILAENQHRVGQVDRSKLPAPAPAPPGRKLAVLACMDARLTVEDVLGLRTGDAHIIRNAGGIATDDAIRSLIISQHLLGTEEVIVVEHTGCGMLTFEDEPVRQQIAAETGTELDLPLHSFPDLESNLRAQVERIRSHPWVKDVPVSGLVYEVESGRLRQVE